MTITALLAGMAGACAAVAVVDLLTVLAASRAVRQRRPERPFARLVGLGRRLGAPAAPPGLAARLAAAGFGDGVAPWSADAEPTPGDAVARATAAASGTGGAAPRAPVGRRDSVRRGRAPACAGGPRRRGELTVADAMAAKAGALLAAAACAVPLAAALPGRLGLLVVLGAAGGGFAAPDLWLARRARRRAARAGLELPDVLDLLRVAVEAGLPTSRALGEVGARHHGLVAHELRAAAARIALGVPRARALATLQARLPLPEVAALVAAVARADRHGAPLGDALAALAVESRAHRARRLHDHAARAAPRIQLVVALLLVPAVLLLVAAGLVQGLD